MSNESESPSDKTLELLEVALKVAEAALDYEALLLKPHSVVTEKEFKAILKRLFSHAHLVDEMRVKNLMDALNCDDDPGYQDYLRRN